MSLSNGAIAAVAIAHSGKHYGSASIAPTATAYTYTGFSININTLLIGTYTLSGQDVSLFVVRAVARQRLTAVDNRLLTLAAVDTRTMTFTAVDDRAAALMALDPRITTLTAVDGRAISFTQTVGDRQI